MRRILIWMMTAVLISAPWAAGAMHHGGGHSGHQPENQPGHQQGAQQAQAEVECHDGQCDKTGSRGCCDVVAVHCAGFFTRTDGLALPTPDMRSSGRLSVSDCMHAGQTPEADTPPPRV